MKKSVLLLFLVLSVVLTQAQEKGIKFEKDSLLKDLLTKAKKQNKLIFIDCYTSWCKPCKQMDREVFKDSAVGNFYNSHFICAKFDMDKGEGKNIAKIYDVHLYPTYLFIDINGILLHLESGSCPVNDFIEKDKTAFNPEIRFSTIKTKCENGTASYSQYIRYLKSISDKAWDDLLKIYFSNHKESEYYPYAIKYKDWETLNSMAWNFYEHVNGIDS